MTDKPKTTSPSGSRSLGLVLVGGLVSAGCGVALFTSDGPTSTRAGGPDKAEQTARAEVSESERIAEIEAASEPFAEAAAAPEPESRSMIAVTPMESARTAAETFTAAAQSEGYADFVVKFENSPEMDAIIRQYRKDESGAKAAFNNWKRGQAALENLEIVGATYSGEALLRRTFRGEAPSRAAVNNVLKDLREAPNVAYSDPDFTAHPGKGEK